MKPLILNHHLNFQDLYTHDGVREIDALFLTFLKTKNNSLHTQLLKDRFKKEDLLDETYSDFLIELAPIVESFITSLFTLQDEIEESYENHHALKNLFKIKRHFIQRKAVKFTSEIGKENLDPALILEFISESFSELDFANQISSWLEDASQHAQKITAALHYSGWALLTSKGQEKHKAGILFKRPEKLNFDHLIDLDHIKHTPRDGFKLTDSGYHLEQALDQAHYCIHCHTQKKDSCRKGLHEKTSSDFQTNPLGNSLEGCPLDQKISEMILLKTCGFSIGSLAVIMVDNPLCAATGHRICNDCMKSCIFQKQSPVDVPQIETRILKDVLNLSWGFEIYGLLSRWNPLNLNQPYPFEPTDKSVLIVGQGPSGFNLAHHLLNLGHDIFAIDGIKIEPLDDELVGESFKPIDDIQTLYESLDNRVMAGFGGVAEYGITVRWDKNFLKIIRLLLERRQNYQLEGGIRFGGSITIEDAFEKYEFDHIALCCGAGKPSLLNLKNNLAKGVRQASDFLMALQLTGAAKMSSLSNLQLRLPVIVIGGGLTAIDSATEALAYYPVQVEKFLDRYEQACQKLGQKKVEEEWSEEDHHIAKIFLTHAKILRAEKQTAKKENRVPDYFPYLKKWGGVKLLYRNDLQKSPAYRLNHEEIKSALEQGIDIITNVNPIEIKTDKYDHVCKLVSNIDSYPAETILIAIGTKPNTVIGREYPDFFEQEGDFFKPIQINNKAHPFFLYQNKFGQSISYLGDMHPNYSGNIVKAMASAKNASPHIDQCIKNMLGNKKNTLKKTKKPLKNIKNRPESIKNRPENIKNLREITSKARLVSKKQHHFKWVELVFHAPLQSEKYELGHFYRLQTFSSKTSPSSEAVALTPIAADPQKGTLTFLISNRGTSSSLISNLKIGTILSLMGPTGAPCEIPDNTSILLMGQGIGNIILSQYATKALAQNCEVIQFIHLRDQTENIDLIHASHKNLTQIFHFEDSKISLEKTLTDFLNQKKCSKIEFIYLNALAETTHIFSNILQENLNLLHKNCMITAAIHTSMQCMMKEICAQCLQKQIDPKTGEHKIIFTCVNPNQNAKLIDFDCLKSRLKQNALSEKLTKIISHN